MSERPKVESLEEMLQRLLRQGTFEPGADRTARIASEGIDRVRTFLAGRGATDDDAGADVKDRTDQVVSDEVVMLRHTIPLADGTRAEVLVPERLSRADAERISAVLTALALG